MLIHHKQREKTTPLKCSRDTRLAHKAVHSHRTSGGLQDLLTRLSTPEDGVLLTAATAEGVWDTAMEDTKEWRCDALCEETTLSWWLTESRRLARDTGDME